MLGQLVNVDPRIAQRVATGLGWQGAIERVAPAVPTRTNLRPSPPLSILAKARPTLDGRVIGVLVADGTDPSVVDGLRGSAKAAGADLKIVDPRVEGAIGAGGRLISADMQLAGGPSVLFDAVVVALSLEGAQSLLREAAAKQWVEDAFSHLKVIGYAPGAASLLEKAGALAGGQPADAGVVALADGGASNFLAHAARGRIWDREPTVRRVY